MKNRQAADSEIVCAKFWKVYEDANLLAVTATFIVGLTYFPSKFFEHKMQMHRLLTIHLLEILRFHLLIKNKRPEN